MSTDVEACAAGFARLLGEEAPMLAAAVKHPVMGRIAGSGGYVTEDSGVVSIRRRDGRVVLEMKSETWARLGRRGMDAGARNEE